MTEIIKSLAKGKKLWIAAGVIGIWLVIRQVTKRKSPPGPFAVPVLGNIIQMQPYIKKFHSHLFFWDVFQQYGDIVQLTLGGKPLIILSDPTEIKRCLNSDEEFIRGDEIKIAMEGVASEALFSQPSGEVWKRHRKILQPSFGPSHIKYAAVVSNNFAWKLTECWLKELNQKEEHRVEFHSAMTAFALDVIGMVGFQYDFESVANWIANKPAQGVETLSSIGKLVMNRLFTPTFLWGLSSLNADHPTNLQMTNHIDSIIKNMVKVKLETGEQKTNWDADILERLLFANQNDKENFTQAEIIDELKGFFFAGHETTANTITFVILVFCLYPDILARVREDTKSIDLKDSNSLYESIPKLKYLDSVLKETQRLYPVVGRTGRQAKKDINILGYDIQKGTTILLMFANANKHPTYWENPEVFNPNRFDRTPISGSFLPFGDGPMNCIGQKMAVLEAKIVTIHLVRHFNFKLSPGFVPDVVTSLTTGLKDGLYVNISKA
ncbi:cytochrome P450 [Globomyces pollinis-pini]|nr:cytochrome P450 [Globomyces pollinis-pini]